MSLYSPRIRLLVWVFYAIVITVLLLWDPKPKVVEGAEAEVAVALTIPHRVASVEEYALSIEDLGKRRLAKRIYILSHSVSYKGDVLWWHDGRQASWSYIPGAGESWNIMWHKIARAVSKGEAQLLFHVGDEALREQFATFPAPYDTLPEGWTIISHQ